MAPIISGKVVRRIELSTGVSANDRKRFEILVAETAPNMRRVYLVVSAGGTITSGQEKTERLVSAAQAAKIAEGLRDDRLRRGFRLMRDWSMPEARFILAAPPADRSAKIRGFELSRANQRFIGALI